MATIPINRETHLKQTQTYWAQASGVLETFDTLDVKETYGKPLNFLPDYFIVKAITYISNNEGNKDPNNPVLVCNFGDNTPVSILGTFSAQGSIKAPNTYYEYTPVDPENPYIIGFEILLLAGKDIALTNVDIDKSTWMVTIEYGKYVEIV